MTETARGRGRRRAAPGPRHVESPTYGGALAAARAAGLRPVPVPADADGLRPELLAAALDRTGARIVYVQPAFANPHGATLSPERRRDRRRRRRWRVRRRGRLGPRPHLRLTYADEPPDRMAEGVARLASVLR